GMIRVSVKVRSDAGCSRVGVRAESIKRAVEIAGTHYPGGEVEVLFPIHPEAFFSENPGPTAEQVWAEVPEMVTG
ncbi:hypothetical protein, partial [Klebsiella pneumoniae]|uniref:hypothetical protein n=1 Tax=Klebsiella pneumoniae TaxID=573 RepID=UPI001E3034E5